MLTVVQASTQTSALEVSRAALVETLDRARHVVPARFPKPILTYMHLEASDNWLRVRATDGDLALFTQMPVEGELPACVVPFAELTRRLKASKHPVCALSLSASKEQLLLNGGRVEHALQTLPVDDFPPVSDAHVGQTVTIDAAELCAGLRVTGLAVAKDASRYAINGVLLESEANGTRLVATDGRRLVVVGLRAVESKFTGRVILPGRMVQLIEKLTDKHTDYLVLSVARQKVENGEEVPGQLFAAGPDWLLSTYEPEGHFPLYQDVTPRSHSKFALERTGLVELLSEVALASSDDSKMVRVDLSSQQARLSAASADVGESAAVLPAKFLGGGDAMIRTAFNPAYLLDALKSLQAKSAKGKKGIFVVVKTLVGSGGGAMGVTERGRRLGEYIIDAVKEQLQVETGKNLSLYPVELLADRFLKDDLDLYRQKLKKFLRDPNFFEEEEFEDVDDFIRDIQQNKSPEYKRSCGNKLWRFYTECLKVQPQIAAESEDILKHMVETVLAEGYAGDAPCSRRSLTVHEEPRRRPAGGRREDAGRSGEPAG